MRKKSKHCTIRVLSCLERFLRSMIFPLCSYPSTNLKLCIIQRSRETRPRHTLNYTRAKSEQRKETRVRGPAVGTLFARPLFSCPSSRPLIQRYSDMIPKRIFVSWEAT
jgi:hypothetical protein